MTAPIDPIREALPVVAWRVEFNRRSDAVELWPVEEQPLMPAFGESVEPLCRLSDAESVIDAVTKVKDAEIEALKGRLGLAQKAHVIASNERESLKADAERYQWLRDKDDSSFDTGMNARHWDAAIDAPKEPS